MSNQRYIVKEGMLTNQEDARNAKERKLYVILFNDMAHALLARYTVCEAGVISSSCPQLVLTKPLTSRQPNGASYKVIDKLPTRDLSVVDDSAPSPITSPPSSCPSSPVPTRVPSPAMDRNMSGELSATRLCSGSCSAHMWDTDSRSPSDA